MAKLTILEYPDPRLRTKAQPVEAVDDSIRQLVDDMFETMYEAKGIGLAATQVNVHQRVLVTDVSTERDRSAGLHQPADHRARRFDRGRGRLPLGAWHLRHLADAGGEDPRPGARPRRRAVRDSRPTDSSPSASSTRSIISTASCSSTTCPSSSATASARNSRRSAATACRSSADPGSQPRPVTMPLRIVFAGTPEFSVPALDALHAAGHSIVAVYTQPDRPAGRGRELAASADQATRARARPRRRATRHAEDTGSAGAPGVVRPRRHGRRGVRTDPAAGRARDSAPRLPQHPCLAAAALARRRADPARRARRRYAHRHLDHADGRRPRHRPGAAAPRTRDRAARDRRRVARPSRAARREGDRRGGGRARERDSASSPRTAGEGVTYAAKIRKDEARIDWTRSAVEIDRLVRAFNPWPVAETRLDGEQVRIWRAQPFEKWGHSELPEEKCGASLFRRAPCWTCPAASSSRPAMGALELLTLQLPGRKPVSAQDVLNARDLRGVRFDSAVAA